MTTTKLDHYIVHIHQPLPDDLVERLGLAGAPGRTYTWAGLSDHDRERALGLVFAGYRVAPAAMRPQMDTAGVYDAARTVADAVYRLSREWESLFEGIDDPDQQDAMRRALEHGFPFGKSLEDVEAEAGTWVEHLHTLASAAPSVLSLVAGQLADDVDLLVDRAHKDARDRDRDADEVIQEIYNGIGGEVGRIAGIFTPTVVSALAALMQEIHHSGDGKITDVAAEFARAYRAARHTSRSAGQLTKHPVPA